MIENEKVCMASTERSVCRSTMQISDTLSRLESCVADLQVSLSVAMSGPHPEKACDQQEDCPPDRDACDLSNTIDTFNRRAVACESAIRDMLDRIQL